MVSRYQDVRACLRNHEQMVNALGNDMDDTRRFLSSGQPDRARSTVSHRAFRGVDPPGFVRSSREIVAMEDHIGGGSVGCWLRFASEVRAISLCSCASVGVRGGPAAGGRADVRQRVLAGAPDEVDGAHGGVWIPEDAFSSNREAEEHLAAAVRQRREQIAAGADSTTIHSARTRPSATAASAARRPGRGRRVHQPWPLSPPCVKSTRATRWGQATVFVRSSGSGARSRLPDRHGRLPARAEVPVAGGT